MERQEEGRVLKVNDLIHGLFLELLLIKRAIHWIRSRMAIQDISPRDEKPLILFL